MTHLKAKSVSEYSKKRAEEKKAKEAQVDESKVEEKLAVDAKLNEEARAQAMKEAGGFFHPIYECHPTDQPQKKIFVEAERWFDARAFAIRHMGAAEMRTVHVEASERPLPRFQIRWVGTAASGTSNPLRLQWREVVDPRQVVMVNSGWNDI